MHTPGESVIGDPMRQHSSLGVFAILTTAVLWGTTGTAATFAPSVSPLAMGAVALGVGGILQAAIAVPAIRREWRALLAHRGLVFTGALAVFIYPLAFYSSMRLAGVAVGTVVSLASAPIFSGIIERVTSRTLLSPRWLAATVLGITGSALLCVAQMSDTSSPTAQRITGIALGLLAGLTYALYSWAVHTLMGRGVHRAAAMGSVFGAGGLALMPVLIATGAPLLESSETFLVGAYMALIPMFLGYVLFGIGLTQVTPSTATTLTLAEPAVATLLAVFIVGESLPAIGWVGIVALASSLLVLSMPVGARARRRRFRSAPAPK